MDHGPDDSENETDKNQTDAESDRDQSDHEPDINDRENETDENQTDAESDGDQSDHEPDINDSENETDENQTDAEKKLRSFTKEFKLSVVNYFYKHGENNLKTSNKFNVGRKQFREWVRNKNKSTEERYPIYGTRSECFLRGDGETTLWRV